MKFRAALIRFAICAALIAATPALAQTYEEGLVAFDKGDFQTAAAFWEPLADAGNAKAQHGLGMLYEAGLGVPAQDYERAAAYYRMAAAQGEIASANNLALMYADGRGVPRDYAQALQLWTMAANAGHPMAQFNLGLMYFRGSGLESPNYNEAAWWFGKAAEGGSIDAQFAMGEMFSQGLGVPQNMAEAERWYLLAAGGGQQAARQRLHEIQTGAFPPAAGSGPDGSAEAGPDGMIVRPAAPDAVIVEESSVTEIVDATVTEEITVEPDGEEEIAETVDKEIVEKDVAVAVEEEAEEVEPEPQSVELPSNAPIAAAPSVVTYAPGPSAGGAAATQTATAIDPAAAAANLPPPEATPSTVPETAPVTAPIFNTVTAPAPEIPTESGIYVLLGQSISTDDGLRAWSELQRDHPQQLGALNSKLVPRGDGSVLIMGGPLASMELGNRICTSLAQRDISLQCYVVNN